MLFLDSGATFGGPDTCYRYNLRRVWNPDLARVCWIMLNPSTADASADDPTIRRCMKFAQTWGYGGITVVNLFALRATKPEEFRRHPSPIGTRNDEFILRETTRASSDLIVAAWGELGKWQGRDEQVKRLLAGKLVRCIGRTFAGIPRHPLYVKGDTQPQAFM